jgi:pyrroline-5-carboxylate reductase
MNKVAILGTGNMGKALIAGLRSKYGDNVTIVAYDQIETCLDGLDVDVKKPLEWFTAGNIPDAIIIAIKPQDIVSAAASLSNVNDYEKAKPLWISIAAGVSLESLQKLLPSQARICRVMPNTPSLVGEGMSACALNANCTDSDKMIAEEIFTAVGKCLFVPEKQINAVTGLSGSGPAYVYLFIEALIEGGVTAGLPYATARELAIQTVIGSARMTHETGENTNALKLKVMSPAGTTAYGLKALEENGFKNAVINAVVNATKRADELGKS